MNILKPSFGTVVYPTGKPVKLRKLGKPKKEPSQTLLSGFEPALGWILTGNVENWKVAIEENVWGVRPELKSLWEHMRKGDRLFFYATRPVSGIIGVAEVGKTLKGDEPFWPNEIRQGRVKYPYRIQFANVCTLKEKEWRPKRLPIKHLNVVYYHGANAIRDEETLRKLVEMTDKLLRDSDNARTVKRSVG